MEVFFVCFGYECVLGWGGVGKLCLNVGFVDVEFCMEW